jgi:hypothetical protein
LNKYFGVSVVSLGLFLLVAAIVSPKTGFNNANDNFPITKSDSAAFLYINKSHYHSFDKWTIWSSKYGRDAFWPIVIILLFVLGGWMLVKLSHCNNVWGVMFLVLGYMEDKETQHHTFY